MQHAVAPPALPVQAEQGDPIHLQCHLCKFTIYSQQGVNVHIEKQHNEQKEPEFHSQSEAPREQTRNYRCMCPSCRKMGETEHRFSKHIYFSDKS